MRQFETCHPFAPIYRFRDGSKSFAFNLLLLDFSSLNLVSLVNLWSDWGIGRHQENGELEIRLFQLSFLPFFYFFHNLHRVLFIIVKFWVDFTFHRRSYHSTHLTQFETFLQSYGKMYSSIDFIIVQWIIRVLEFIGDKNGSKLKNVYLFLLAMFELSLRVDLINSKSKNKKLRD